MNKSGDARKGLKWLGKFGHWLADFSFQDYKATYWLINRLWDVGYYNNQSPWPLKRTAKPS